jgi:Ran GTPase-activating protein (RanGAP) involved in mRNA processing and transport
MSEEYPDPVEGLKENAVSSYGENRLDAIETLATFGEDAVPALVEITNEVNKEKPQQLARKKIREINKEQEIEIENVKSIEKEGDSEDSEDDEGNL